MKANKKKFVEVRGMCNALQELMKDELEEAEKAGIEKGIEKGIEVVIENCKEFHLSYEQTVHKIAEKYELPTEKAEEYMKRFW